MSGGAALQKDRNFIAVIGDEVWQSLFFETCFEVIDTQDG
jgi:hypothetical protein